MFTFKSNRLLKEKMLILIWVFFSSNNKKDQKKDAFPIIREFYLIIDHLDYP